MLYLPLALVIIALVFGPQLWVRAVLGRYHRQEERFPGTAGELARHLLDRFGLHEVRVEATPAGDHYDPLARAVRLTADKLNARTLTAITTAAHEVGHALQDAADEPMFRVRTRLAMAAAWAQRVGSFLLFAAPLAVLVARAPSPGVISAAGAFLMLGFGVLVQLLTLPVEWDASFRKALPLLRSGYLEADQVPHARRILRACALTYVAGSLASLLNVWRWLAVLRR